MSERNPVVIIMMFIFLIAGMFAINLLPVYFTAMQKMILYLVVLMGFGVVMAFIIK